MMHSAWATRMAAMRSASGISVAPPSIMTRRRSTPVWPLLVLMACLVGSALNGVDAFRTAMDNYQNRGPLKVSPYLLPNLCANLPAGKAGMLMGFTGPIFSPQGACASGNHAIGIGAHREHLRIAVAQDATRHAPRLEFAQHIVVFREGAQMPVLIHQLRLARGVQRQAGGK